jgi:nickel-dependent lactate racemase
MPSIELRYGLDTIPFTYEEGRCQAIDTGVAPPPLSDVEIGRGLDDPIGSPALEDICEPGKTVLFVVPDATRQSGCGQIINLLVRRLIANGTRPDEMACIFATGIHRPVTQAEKAAILTPFVAQRIRTLDHDANDAIRNFRVGETTGGIPVELNWTLTEFDRTVLIGGVTFHYFAGFTGGRKLVCPGLASSRTIDQTHKLAFDCDLRSRREGVGPGRLDGNPVHEAFVEAAAFAKPSFAVNTLVDGNGVVTGVFCGDWSRSHRSACDAYGARHTVRVYERRPLVIASCGGYPFDINLIQAHKTLEAATHACVEGGTIALVAECADGAGREDFLDWFDLGSSESISQRLCERYQVNGQTAWNLRRITERFDVRLMSRLDDVTIAKLGCQRLNDLREIPDQPGYIIPFGPKLLLLS